MVCVDDADYENGTTGTLDGCGLVSRWALGLVLVQLRSAYVTRFEQGCSMARIIRAR